MDKVMTEEHKRDEAVPTGWKLVPVEPTEAMIDAYWEQTGESKEMRPRTHAYMRRYWSAMLSAAPATAGWVDAMRDRLMSRWRLTSERAQQVAMDLASLFPAATSGSEAGGDDWMERKAARENREVEIMQEYRWGNLTPLGVANHLRRAGFNIDYAVKVSNALAKPSSPAGGDVREALISAYTKVAEWPENRMSENAIEAIGEGFMDLLALRNLVPSAIAVLSPSTSAAEPVAKHNTDAITKDRSLAAALKAIAEGYAMVVVDDRYIVVDNPAYRPDDGSSLKLVVDTALFQSTSTGRATEPYAHEFGRSNGDGTFSVVIERGEPKRASDQWPIKPLYAHPAPMKEAVEAIDRLRRWMPPAGQDEQIDADLKFASRIRTSLTKEN